MKLRKAHNKDLALIKRLLKENDLPFEDVSSKIKYFFIGYIKSEIIGIGGLEIYGQYGLLRSLVVIDRFRGRGCGKMLTLKLIEYAKEIKLKEVYLLTITAKEYFEKFGFREINRDQVPTEIKNSTEFKYLCPSTAICMKLRIQK